MNVETELQKVLRYEPDTGLLYWTADASKAVRGKQAGTLNRGYIVVMYKSKFYKAHRVAWLLTHGHWPAHSIDHINGIKSDNRLENLRDVDDTLNQQNRHRARVDSKSGLMGASPYRNRWKSQIRVNGEVRYLGVFDTPELAHLAYVQAKQQHHIGREKNA